MQEADVQPNVLVLGASGYVGSHLVPALQQSGKQVRAGARRLESIQNKHWPGVECRYVDALSEESLCEALQGITTVYYLIHSMNSGKGFAKKEQACAENFVTAARKAKVSHVIYMGALTPAYDLSEHLSARQQTGKILRDGGLTVTEIRAGIVVGPGSAAYEVIRDLVNALPAMITPKWVHTKSPPIALTNLLTYLTELPNHTELFGQTLDVAGPERLSYAELMLQYGELVKRKPPIFPVPLMTPRLSSYWLRLVTAVPTNLARALIDGLSQDLVANDDVIRNAIPQKLLTYREAVQQALTDDQNLQVYSRWVEGAIQFRNFRTDTSFYAKQCVVEQEGSANIEQLWHRVTHLGGDNGYPAMNWLWQLRAWMDWAVGGPGRNRGRAHESIQVGDTIDSWRVVAFEPGRSLSLQMGMKAPGEGVLEFTCEPTALGSRLRIAAYWHPSNIFGHLYWMSLWPVHQVLFQQTAKKLLSVSPTP